MDDNGCFSATCGKQNSQDISVAKKCTIKKTVDEDVDGCKLSLLCTVTRRERLTFCRVDKASWYHHEGMI